MIMPAANDQYSPACGSRRGDNDRDRQTPHTRMIPSRTVLRSQADDLLARDYERIKRGVISSVRSRLIARWGLRFADLDLEAFYNDAWQTLYDRLRGGKDVHNTGGFLVVVASRRAIDEAWKRRDTRSTEGIAIDDLGVDDDVAAMLDRKTLLRNFQEAMCEVLTKREHQAMKFCLFRGYTRPEVAKRLNESPHRMEKIMDSAQRKLRPLVKMIENDEWCTSRVSPLRALALGLLDKQGARYQGVTAHLAVCPACRRDLIELREIAA